MTEGVITVAYADDRAISKANGGPRNSVGISQTDATGPGPIGLASAGHCTVEQSVRLRSGVPR